MCLYGPVTVLGAGGTCGRRAKTKRTQQKLPLSFASLSSFPLLGRREQAESTLHGPCSPFKEVAIDGWKPLQRHRVSRVAHNLGSQGDRRRLLGGLPALVHQVQVAVHSGDLIGREGVSAVVVCKGQRER